MDIITTTADDTPLLTLSGRFDAFETERFRTIIDGLLDQSNSTISVDLHGVHFTDSSALAELVRAMKRCRERDGELILCSLSDSVRVILELTRLNAAFEIRGD